MSRPYTPLSRVCPAYRAALDEHDRALARSDEKAAAEAWARVLLITEAFNQGAAFGMDAAAGVRR